MIGTFLTGEPTHPTTLQRSYRIYIYREPIRPLIRMPLTTVHVETAVSTLQMRPRELEPFVLITQRGNGKIKAWTPDNKRWVSAV